MFSPAPITPRSAPSAGHPVITPSPPKDKPKPKPSRAAAIDGDGDGEDQRDATVIKGDTSSSNCLKAKEDISIPIAERKQGLEGRITALNTPLESTTNLSRSSQYNGKRGNVVSTALKPADTTSSILDKGRLFSLAARLKQTQSSTELGASSPQSPQQSIDTGSERGSRSSFKPPPLARFSSTIASKSLSSLCNVTNSLSSRPVAPQQSPSADSRRPFSFPALDEKLSLRFKVPTHPGSGLHDSLPTVRIVPPESECPQLDEDTSCGGNEPLKGNDDDDDDNEPSGQLPNYVADSATTLVPVTPGHTSTTTPATPSHHAPESNNHFGTHSSTQAQQFLEVDEPPPPINPKSPARAFQRQDLSGLLRFLLPRLSAPNTVHRPLSFVAGSAPSFKTESNTSPIHSNLPTLKNPSFKHHVASARIVSQSTFQPAQACSVDLVSEAEPAQPQPEPGDTPVIYPDHFQRQALIDKYKSQAKDNGSSMEDEEGNVAMPRLEDLLRYPEDLDKISTLKAEYSRKKAAVDSQLREGLRDQLETVQRCMNQLGDGQRHIMKTRDELRDIDKLCAESQDTVGDFSQIDKLARIQRNFDATILMKNRLESFESDLAEIEKLLKEDDDDLENLPNLLPAHMAISKLRDFRDEAMDQIRKAHDKSAETTLTELFSKLDEVIDWFDEHLGGACMKLIPFVQSSNTSIVVRIAVVIMNEEKKDSKVLALQEAQKDHKDLASRFKSMNIGPKTVHGYKDKFLEAIRLYAQAQFDDVKDKFLVDPDNLEKEFRWFFNDLVAVKKGMQSLMPKKWKIFQTYTNIYHKLMHDFLMEFVNDPELPASNMLSIIHWTGKYYQKMGKLGWQPSDLHPNVLDDKEGELVRDWRNLIIKSLDEWMERFNASDRKCFLARDADLLDTTSDGLFLTKTHGDMWRMIYEQIQAAAASQRTDVMEGVIDAMFRSLKNRQMVWQNQIDDEVARYKTMNVSEQSEGIQAFQDWLIAVANDQIAVIDDGDASAGGAGKDAVTQQTGYLTKFRRDFEPHVSPKFLGSRADAELDSLRDGYVDLATHCLSAFNDLIFTVDFATTLPDFFTSKWYSSFDMKRITSTFEDYMSDYSSVLHPSLLDVLVEELSDKLLIKYLSSVRNKGAKFRRQDPWTEKFKDDVLTVFAFFQKYPDSFASTIKDRWRLVDWLVRLLEADKTEGVVFVYEGFKTEYWDLPLSWVEAVLRARDDFERSMVSSVKAKAAELNVERGPETLMSKLR
ncbi:exocyst complex component Sec6 [Ascosphaera apis ARSEF 7405]|uniref:Exocyst complex component Sec6 n=1 Tax=Ascosphaera apis ARSEF 7405 TaxID=392613 RepID=A0A167UZC2_9EURO|nr:exocyst complex component Sec6 [Ascosphaera apis ARSEF 7405]